jgi:type IV pilus assembly protein PilO
MTLRKYFTLDGIMNLPSHVRLWLLVVIFLLLIGLAYIFYIRFASINVVKLHRQENNLRVQYTVNHKRLLQFQVYKKQAGVLSKTFEPLSLQLPKQIQMAPLLRSISNIGQDVGLRFKLFDPLPLKKHDHYTVLPIDITVSGNYHQLASFINRISQLDQLITFENFVIKSSVKDEEGEQEQLADMNNLNMSMLLYVYYRNIQTKDDIGDA